MHAGWPWGNAEEWPDEAAFVACPPEPVVHPTDDDDEVALLGPDGEPIRWVARHPVGFALPRRAEEISRSVDQ